MSDSRKILLVGMMGAGKTTTGRLLADRLGWPYRDSDEQVERRTGRTIPQIWSEDGEAAFRREESAALRESCSEPGPAVVSVAGGAVLDPANRRELLSSGDVVWLRARTSTLAGRVGDGSGRPLLEGDPAAVLARLAGERDPIYAELARTVVEVDGLAPSAVADAVMREMGLDARVANRREEP